MSLDRPIVYARALPLGGAAFALACAAAGVAPAPNVREPAPAVTPATSISATAPAPAIPVASAPQAIAPAPPPSAEPAPPCVDGEIAMGICVCDKGKGADTTGHCVYPPCPKSTTGGTPFRNETTGQCMECRAGTKPTKDGRCER